MASLFTYKYALLQKVSNNICYVSWKINKLHEMQILLTDIFYVCQIIQEVSEDCKTITLLDDRAICYRVDIFSEQSLNMHRLLCALK